MDWVGATNTKFVDTVMFIVGILWIAEKIAHKYYANRVKNQ